MPFLFFVETMDEKNRINCAMAMLGCLLLWLGPDAPAAARLSVGLRYLESAAWLGRDQMEFGQIFLLTKGL